MLTYIYSISMLSWLSKVEKDLENLFCSCHKVNFRKKHILAIFRIVFPKIDIISDVIIAITSSLKFFFYQFFCNIAKYDCAKFHVKSIFLSGFMQGGTMCSPRGMIRQKYPRADKVNNFLKIDFLHIGSITFFVYTLFL